MSAEIATLDRVRNAVTTLRQRGVKPTANRVIELIGGGGKSRVLEHLRSLRAPADDPDSVPPSVLEIARMALSDIYEAGRKAEADKTRAASERLSIVVEEQDAQIMELDQEIGRLVSSVEVLESRLRDSDAVADALKEQILGIERSNAELQSQLDAEEHSSTDGLKAALARFEALVEEAVSVQSNNRQGSKK